MRPIKNISDRKATTIGIYMTIPEKEKIAEQARKESYEISIFARHILLNYCNSKKRSSAA